MSACSGGGGSPPPSPLSVQSQPSVAAPEAGERTIDATLSATPQTYALPLTNGYSVSLSLHALGAPANTRISIGVRQPDAAPANERSPMWQTHPVTCAPTTTIPLYNPFPYRIVVLVDSFSEKVPCNVDGTLFGVSFYQLQPVPNPVTSTKIGNITASGHEITFTSDVTEITLPPRSETAITITPEATTSEVAIPIVPGSNTVLTANSPSLPSSLSANFSSSGGGGTLFSSGCYPAYVDGELAAGLQGVPIEGIASFYCQLGTVNSPTVLFGAPTVTFTIGSPIPDSSFLELDGAAAEYVCSQATSPTCVTPEFTVPVVQNVLVGNVKDLQACFRQNEGPQDCNTNGNPTAPVPTPTSIAANKEVSMLVADDPSYAPPAAAGSCTAPAICGGFILDTSAGSCRIDNGPDENGDVPKNPPYKDPGGPQEYPPVSSGTSTHAFFPKQGPYVEFDLIAGGSGTTCIAKVTEADGPLQRSTTISVPVKQSCESSARAGSETTWRQPQWCT